MKKKIFLVGTLVAIAMSAMFISCEKKDSVSKEEINGCKCSYYADGEKYTGVRVEIEDMEDYLGVSSCSQLEKYLEREVDLDDVSCKEY